MAQEKGRGIKDNFRMNMTKEDNPVDWQKLDWQVKMQICQRGMVHEESLLNTYVTLFIAVEAMFFAFVLGVNLVNWLNIIIAIIGILVTIRFAKTFYDRGKQVDLWGALIYNLLQKIDADNHTLLQITDRYEGCSVRITKDWKSIVFGWGTISERLKHFFWGYARRLKTTLIPFIVILSWTIVIIISVFSS